MVAYLLSFYQEMRLKREIAELTFKQTTISSKVSRLEKNIENKQKYYTSLFENLKRQAENMKNQGTCYFQNMLGIGAGSVNPYDYTGMNGFIYNAMASMFNSNITGRKDAQGNALPDIELGATLFNQMMTEYQANNGSFIPEIGEDKKQVYDESGHPKYKNFNYDQVCAFNQAMQAAKQQQTFAQNQAQSMSQQYGNNISIWLDAQQAQLEAEQDSVLGALQYEQTMMDLDMTSTKAKLERKQKELEAYSENRKNAAEDIAPDFGV